MEQFETTKEIGKKIRQKREKLRKSQKEFAELLGIHVQQISRYERGLTRPRDATLKKILEYGSVIEDSSAVKEPVEKYQTASPDEKLLDAARKILTGEDRDIADALRANLKVFGRMEETRKEKRRTNRFFLNVPVDVKFLNEPETQFGVGINGSQLGLCIQSRHRLEIGKRVNLEVTFVSGGQIKSFKADAEIVWRAPHELAEAESYQYGVKFIDIFDEGLSKLETLLYGEGD